ncbi:exopolysaccharide biosynthesis protein [Candidatus Saccharibacteria bacterium]|nr:exopolysaccharide biosynthesis protein [Candidatus Saccharibacteria bacterium]
MTRSNIPFSQEIDQWLSASGKKTVGDLQTMFGEKSFAILILIFMFIPALPIPTGGITTVFLIPASIFASVQMMLGKKSLWLPKFLKKIKLGDATLTKALPFIIKRIEWFEKFSRPRLSSYIPSLPFRVLNGLMIVLFTIGSLIAPPFSWLDTLPSLGAVILSLGIILEDVLLVAIGSLVGLIGLGLIMAAATLVVNFLHNISGWL